MLFRNLVAIAAIPVLATSLISGAARAQKQAAGSSETASSDQSCVISEYAVTWVSPFRVNERFDKQGPVSRVGGAEFYVTAQPGLTGEWLQLRLDRRIAQRRDATVSDCPLDVEGVRADVVSAGPGFTVRLTAPSVKSAQEVIRRAERLAPPLPKGAESR
jgi:hypothetical protein